MPDEVADLSKHMNISSMIIRPPLSFTPCYCVPYCLHLGIFSSSFSISSHDDNKAFACIGASLQEHFKTTSALLGRNNFILIPYAKRVPELRNLSLKFRNCWRSTSASVVSSAANFSSPVIAWNSGISRKKPGKLEAIDDEREEEEKGTVGCNRRWERRPAPWIIDSEFFQRWKTTDEEGCGGWLKEREAMKKGLK